MSARCFFIYLFDLIFQHTRLTVRRAINRVEQLVEQSQRKADILILVFITTQLFNSLDIAKEEIKFPFYLWENIRIIKIRRENLDKLLKINEKIHLNKCI